MGSVSRLWAAKPGTPDNKRSLGVGCLAVAVVAWRLAAKKTFVTHAMIGGKDISSGLVWVAFLKQLVQVSHALVNNTNILVIVLRVRLMCVPTGVDAKKVQEEHNALLVQRAGVAGGLAASKELPNTIKDPSEKSINQEEPVQLRGVRGKILAVRFIAESLHVVRSL